MSEVYQPLVSVYVVTYNSSKTVIETLDSIYNQTYPNIELIVSDDCSTDNTVELCREWIDSHKDRFVRTELLTVEKNTGVAGNCNRAEAACRGEWSKGIAGDDIMLPNCIEECVNYVTEHPDSIIVFSRMECFGDVDDEQLKWVDQRFDYSFFDMSQEEQLHRLIFIGNCLPAPTNFVHIERMKATGVRNDERIPLLEDWPKWINLLRAGVRFGFIDKELVRYRITPGALSTSAASERYLKSVSLMFLYYRFKPMIKEADNKMDVLHMYVRAQKSVTGRWYWSVLNRLMKWCGNN